MLRIKKFSHIKKRKLYRFLKSIKIDHNDSTQEKCDTIVLNTYYIHFYFSDDLCYDFIKHKTFFINDVKFDYVIQKEIYTDTWMLVCDKLLLLYIDSEDIEEFCLSYMFSSFYNFIIYETFCGYIAVSISHTTDKIDDVLEFYMMNASNPKYILLSYFLNNNLQQDLKQQDLQEQDLQQRYLKNNSSIDIYHKDIIGKYLPNISSFIILNKNVQIHKNCDLYKFYDIIGYGEINNELKNFVEFIFNYQTAFKHYPMNYLPI